MVVAVEQFARLSNIAVAAALEPQKWQQLVDELGTSYGSQFCTQLMGYDKRSEAAPLAFWSGYDPQMIELYEQHYLDKNPFAARFNQISEGKAVSTHQLCPPDILKKTAFYNDLLRPHEDIHCGGGTVLVQDEHRMFLLGGNIRAKDQDRFEDDWMQLCLRLAPIMKQSLEINRMISGLSFEKWAANRHQLGDGTAIMAVDTEMTIRFACASAQEMLAKGHIIGSSHDQKVRFSSEHIQTALSNLASRQGNGRREKDQQAGFRNFRISDRTGRNWIFRSVGLNLAEVDQSPFGTAFTNSLNGLLVAIKPETASKNLQTLVQQTFELSPTEAEISVGLSEGKTVAQIAEMRGVSIHTVRNQLKAALSKSDCRRQSQLVQKVDQLRNLAPE